MSKVTPEDEQKAYNQKMSSVINSVHARYFPACVSRGFHDRPRKYVESKEVPLIEGE